MKFDYIKLEKLRKIRKNKNISIYDMATYLNITPSFYCQIENGRRRLFADVAVKISKILDSNPDELFMIFF